MSKIINQRVEERVPVSSLTLNERNANQGDIGAIYESIEANGFYGTIVAQRSTGKVLAGNHRLQAAISAGIDEVPVCWVNISDEEALRLLVVDNRTARLGRDDETILAALLSELANSEVGLIGTGFDGDDLDNLINDLAGTEKEAPEDFATFDENIETQHECPKCGYCWSGKSNDE